MQTRIIAGTKKGKKLQNPEYITRPLTDRIKTSIFDLIKGFIPDSVVLDLYAGGGNFGIEALSRGAKRATFVDISRESINCINQNLTNADLAESSKVVQSNVQDFVRSTEEEFDLIMCDPPFDKVVVKHIDDAAKLLKDDGLLIFRYPETLEINLEEINLNPAYQKKYGKSIVIFFQKA